MFPKRTGLIVWITDAKAARNLERFGHVVYISKRLNYALVYVNQSEVEDKISYIKKLNFVNKVERSHRADLNNIFPTKKLV